MAVEQKDKNTSLTKEEIEQRVKVRFEAAQDKVAKGTLATEQHPSSSLIFHGPGED